MVDDGQDIRDDSGSGAVARANVPRLKLRHESIILFGLGLLALAPSMIGSVKPWDEYQECNYLNIPQLCITRSLPVGQKPENKTIVFVRRHHSLGLFKILSAGIASIILPISASKLFKVGDVLAKQEEVDLIIEENDSKIFEKKAETNTWVETELLEIQASMEVADAVQRLEQSFQTDVSHEDIEKQALEFQQAMENNQKQLQKTQDYKALEFGEKKITVELQDKQQDKRELSVDAQEFLNFLTRNGHKSITFSKASSSYKKLGVSKIKELCEELVSHELGKIEDKTFTLFFDDTK